MELVWFLVLYAQFICTTVANFSEQPLARIAIEGTLALYDSSVSISASPDLLGVKVRMPDNAEVYFGFFNCGKLS